MATRYIPQLGIHVHDQTRTVTVPGLGQVDSSGNVTLLDGTRLRAGDVPDDGRRNAVIAAASQAADVFGAGGVPGLPQFQAPVAPAQPAGGVRLGVAWLRDGTTVDDASSTVKVPGLGWVNRNGWTYLTDERQTVPAGYIQAKYPQYLQQVILAAQRAVEVYGTGTAADRSGAGGAVGAPTGTTIAPAPSPVGPAGQYPGATATAPAPVAGPSPYTATNPPVTPNSAAHLAVLQQAEAQRRQQEYERQQAEVAQRAAEDAARRRTNQARIASLESHLGALPPLNQINARNFLALPRDSQQFVVGLFEQRGHSENDVWDAVSRSLPRFVAPQVGTVRR